MILEIILSFLMGYLFGAIPFGLLLCFLFGGEDIRKIGSGNIGATNVLRTGHKGLAIATLILDGAKGAIAVLLAFYVFKDLDGSIVAIGAVLGHVFPVWLKFKGGKGVATTLGVLLALSWPVGVASCITWLISAFLFRISSLAALIAMVSAPVFSVLLGGSQYVFIIGFLALLVFIRHHENIKRLLNGEEAQIKLKKDKI